jgi:putative ubiquitin-RnfH superfamily antitoxin RatB of RatAB toxin-antitoxin module
MASIRVEVVYALPDAADCVSVVLTTPATARDAIVASGLLERYAELSLGVQKIGVFGKTAVLETRLSVGDRVEIYRPLAVDPKEARRRRAAKKRKPRA